MAVPWVFPRNCPSCDTPLQRKPGEADWRCPNKQSCPSQGVEWLDHFAEWMEIDHLGRSTAAQLLWERPDVAAETGIYLRHLIAVYDGLPPDADRFGALTQAAFALALERSADHDPLLENRSAIFALEAWPFGLA